MKIRKTINFILCLFFTIAAGILFIESADSSTSKSQIIFNHQFHIEEAGVQCETCHAKAGKSMKSDDTLYPPMDVCGECHDVSDEKMCSSCHSNPENVIPSEGFHENYEVFAHKKHIDKGFKCTDCHKDIAKSEELKTGTYLPEMGNCIDCHSKKGGTMDCAACHYGKHPQPGDLNVLEWTRTHGLEAAFNPDYFMKYFELGYCEDCHQGLNLKGETHQPGWLFTHGDEAASGGDCQLCHEDRSSCTTCHRSMIPIPHPLLDPTFANEDGGTHTEDAKAFMEVCLSCHDEGDKRPTCARCH